MGSIAHKWNKRLKRYSDVEPIPAYCGVIVGSQDPGYKAFVDSRKPFFQNSYNEMVFLRNKIASHVLIIKGLRYIKKLKQGKFNRRTTNEKRLHND